MGNYASASDVASEFKGIDFGASGSKVTTAEVDEFITQAEAQIDARIGTRYVTPVTSVSAISILKNLTILAVADRVSKILELKETFSPELGQLKGRGSEQVLPKAVKAELKDIVGGDVAFDADKLSAADGVRSWATDSGQEHKFQRDVDQW